LKKKFLLSPLFTQSWDCLGWTEQGLALQHSSNTYNQSTGKKTQTQTNKPKHWKNKHKHKKTHHRRKHSRAEQVTSTAKHRPREKARTALGKKEDEEHSARRRTKNNGEEGGPRTMGKN